MRRALPAAIIAACLYLVTTADAHRVTAKDYRQALGHVYQYRHHGGDFRAFGGAKHGRDRLQRWRAHARGPVALSVMRRDTRVRVRAWRWHRHIDRITPYGPWAIPWPVVACESGGSWNAYNPSGALGPYQLLGWGAPFPVTTPGHMAQHHRIAARLWAGGAGASHWVCA